ncbi:hypothetical protein [Pacificibacter sp. AS14]|uniref:hypothetical protein n=1 Tax=Pacificibacter sp. AS14 TaxID=3135785 RepID=UPI003181176C
MYGLILWYDPEKNKAIVWCDDSDKLAYASSTDITLGATETLEVGDLVTFDIVTFGEFRGCINLKLVEAQNAPEISRSLLASAPQKMRAIRA